jgi:hypothetical protein
MKGKTTQQSGRKPQVSSGKIKAKQTIGYAGPWKPSKHANKKSKSGKR